MELALSTCFVIVDDPERALAFYRDVLGLQLRNDVARGGFRWITVGAPSQPEVGIVLTNYLGGVPADRERLAQLRAKGALQGLHFRCAELDAAFETAKAAGAEIVQEPKQMPWGVRDFALLDPAGNLLRVAEAAAER